MASALKAEKLIILALICSAQSCFVLARKIKVRKSNGTSMKFRFNRMPCFWIFSSLIEMYVFVSEGKKRYLFGKFCVRSTWTTPRNMKITSSF